MTEDVSLPVSSAFDEELRRVNNLDKLGFEEWLFHPGMLFGATNKWWGNQGKRETPHEGVDLRFYRTQNGEVRHLDEKAKMPVMFEGVIVKVIDDFLGKSVFVRHGFSDSRGRRLHSIYGHIKPYRRVCPGAAVSEGDVIGTIADASKRNEEIPSHVHISLAWIPASVPLQELGWGLVADASKAALVDPLSIILYPHSIIRSV